jgi:CRISPR/Cas system-associated exonuclease Cas4 (RecB family)
MKVLNSDEGLLFYENRNTNAILVMPIYMNERISIYGDYLFDWMRQVKAAYDNGEMAAVPWKNGLKNKNCLYCPLKEVCPTFGGEDDVSIPPLKVLVV